MTERERERESTTLGHVDDTVKGVQEGLLQVLDGGVDGQLIVLDDEAEFKGDGRVREAEILELVALVEGDTQLCSRKK